MCVEEMAALAPGLWVRVEFLYVAQVVGRFDGRERVGCVAGDGSMAVVALVAWLECGRRKIVAGRRSAEQTVLHAQVDLCVDEGVRE